MGGSLLPDEAMGSREMGGGGLAGDCHFLCRGSSPTMTLGHPHSSPAEHQRGPGVPCHPLGCGDSVSGGIFTCPRPPPLKSVCSWCCASAPAQGWVTSGEERFPHVSACGEHWAGVLWSWVPNLHPALPYVQASGSAWGEPGLLSGGSPRVGGHPEAHKSDGHRACGQSPCVFPLGRVCAESQLWPECRGLGGHVDAVRQSGEPPAPRAERDSACCFGHGGRRGRFALVVKTQQREIFA